MQQAVVHACALMGVWACLCVRECMVCRMMMRAGGGEGRPGIYVHDEIWRRRRRRKRKRRRRSWRWWWWKEVVVVLISFSCGKKQYLWQIVTKITAGIYV